MKPRYQVDDVLDTRRNLSIPGTSCTIQPGVYNCYTYNIDYLLTCDKRDYGNYIGETSNYDLDLVSKRRIIPGKAKYIHTYTYRYCCLVWTPSHMDTNWSRLQRAQNSALRIATGRPKFAVVAEQHQAARELPVRQHNELISQQFAFACHLQ